MREALTKAEAEALAEKLGRPITWPAVHHHGSPEGVWQQKDAGSDGSNQVPAKGTHT
jgi:hypothetical protein